MPVLLIIAAVGLFVMYTNPTYQNIKSLQTESEQYNTALTQSSQVRAQRDQLLARRNTFPATDVERLQRLLPDSVDNIRLIIDINNVAARYHLQVTNVSLSTLQGAAQGGVGNGTSSLGSVQISFSIAATYNDFQSFLQDLEHSLRIIDVESIRFSAGGSSGTAKAAGIDSYTLTIKTYWLR